MGSMSRLIIINKAFHVLVQFLHGSKNMNAFRNFAEVGGWNQMGQQWWHLRVDLLDLVGVYVSKGFLHFGERYHVPSISDTVVRM